MMSMKSSKILVWLFGVFLVGITIVTAGTAPLKKRSLVVLARNGDPEDPSSDQVQKSRVPTKRTFCNAFTGCGRKRSDSSMPPKDYEYEVPAETSDEVAVDDIARDILAEARLWEALQARNSIRVPFRNQPGFFPRQKRAVMEKEKTK